MADSTEKNYTVEVTVMLLQEAPCSCGTHTARCHKYGNSRIGFPYSLVELGDIAYKTLAAVSEHESEVISLNDTFSVAAVIVYHRNEALFGKIVHKRIIAFLMFVHAMNDLHYAIHLTGRHCKNSRDHKLVEI